MTHQNPHLFKIQSGISTHHNSADTELSERTVTAERLYDEAELMHWYSGGYSVRKDGEVETL